MAGDETWARILVVDDQQANVILLQRMLAQWGYENVTVTVDSSTVHDLCKASPPDLILLDLQMPPPDGFELMEILRPITAGPPYVPILVLTADATQATRQRALAGGANDFLSKPLEPVEVRLRIGNLLETRRLQLELFSRNQHLEEAVRDSSLDGLSETIRAILGELGGEGAPAEAVHAPQTKRDGLKGAAGL